MWGYSDGLNEPFKYETGLNESTLRHIIDTTFPIPKEKDVKFSDCFFGKDSKDFFDLEDYYSW